MKKSLQNSESRRILGEGNFLRLIWEDTWEFVERVKGTGVVAIVAVTDDGNLLLTEQFRPAVRGNVIDLPAGLAGDLRGRESEDLQIAALRELTEETGFRAERIEYLAAGPTSPGLCTEVVTFFHARNLARCGPGGGDDSEEIVVHEIPLAEARPWLQDRSIQQHVDPKVYAGLFLARLD